MLILFIPNKLSLSLSLSLGFNSPVTQLNFKNLSQAVSGIVPRTSALYPPDLPDSGRAN
jgi:hypothetical protein